MTPIFIIRKHGDLYAVVEVGLDETNPLLQPTCPSRFALRGEAAALLYVALAGHRFGTAPERARRSSARHARAAIHQHQRQYSYHIAYRVVQCFGPFIMPWLGVLKVDQHGRAVLDDPIYQERTGL